MNLSIAYPICRGRFVPRWWLWRWGEGEAHGLSVDVTSIDGPPATVLRAKAGSTGPVVVIAHGFAGSQQLMLPFVITWAHAGYVAVTFNFPGHGRNPVVLTGSIPGEGAARRLFTRRCLPDKTCTAGTRKKPRPS